jgi:methyl-accepting chemotaxis protein
MRQIVQQVAILRAYAPETQPQDSPTLGNAGKMTELVRGIAQGSQEQSQGVDQLNIAVSQMDKVTQENAAGAEGSASAAEELTAQAHSLQSTVEELLEMIKGSA